MSALRPERCMPAVPAQTSSKPPKTPSKRVRHTKPVLTGFKPNRIPLGFSLVVDTREQKPLFANPQSDLPVIHRCLPIGDYSVDGYERQIAFELKRLSDLLSFIGVEHDRTVGKLERMAACRFSALVIQEDERTLAGIYKYSKLTREHVRGFLLSCRVKYGIHVYHNKDAEALERYILDSAIKTWGELQHAKPDSGL